MARKFSALMAALAIGSSGIAYADTEGKEGTEKRGDTRTDPTAKPSEKSGDESNGNNDSTNNNDATDNYKKKPGDTGTPGDTGKAGTRGDTGTSGEKKGSTADKGGVTDTRESTSPGNPGTSGTLNPATNSEPGRPGGTTEASRGATKENASVDTANLIGRLHEINQMEVRLGRLAAKKAKNKSVRSYGSMMVRDHTKADRELTNLARKLKIAIIKPEAKDDTEKESMRSAQELERRLQAARGGQFDVMYLTGMVTGHTEAIDLVNTAKEKITDTQVRSFLEKLLPSLKNHRTEAQKTLDKLKATS